MPTYVSLFRGINVGGSRKAPMKELKAVHEEMGFENVQSLLQTGNIVFTCKSAQPAELEKKIAATFEKQFGFKSDVIVRTAAEIKKVFQSSPYAGKADHKPNWVVVAFLADKPSAEALKALEEAHKGPEEFELKGRELHIYYPEGIGRSKFNPLLPKLKTPATARNWNTVEKLVELLKS